MPIGVNASALANRTAPLQLIPTIAEKVSGIIPIRR